MPVKKDKPGMERNVLVKLAFSRSMENVSLAILTHTTMETLVSATLDSSESERTNVTNVTALVPNVMVLKKMNALCAQMLATLLRKVHQDAVLVLETATAQLVFTTTKVTVNHAHLTARNVNQKMSVNLVFQASK